MSESKATYGLVGYPVEHSLSPLMHNAAFDELQVDAVYKLFPLKENELEGFINELREPTCPIFGLNVTVPYKEKVIDFLDSLSPFAQKIMAVNTIVISNDRKLSGFNTDGSGFLTHLNEIGFDTGKKRVSILGAGGASRAIISVLCLIADKPESIRIYDVDKEKADYLIDDLGNRFDVSNVESVQSIDDLNIEISDLLINATPIGMQDDDICLVDKDLLHSNMLVYDLIYNPEKTKLLSLAESCGAQIANGLGMLFYQGVLSFQHWADVQLDKKVKDIMRKNLEIGLKK